MRVEYHEATGCPFGQFVIYAESAQDGAIIKAFLGGMQSESGNWRESGWEFRIGGWCYDVDLGRTTSLNVGWQKNAEEAAKDRAAKPKGKAA